MTTEVLVRDLEQALAEIPLMDAHTHLVGGKLGARGLHDILLYHMAISDLYAAGCPSGARLTEYPNWPTQEEAHARLAEAVPFLPQVYNTSSSWAVRVILAELYNWRKPITVDNWHHLDAMICERANDRAWHHSILDRLNIERTCTELARREAGQDDERMQYALEWGFFTRSQWGEYDTALYELERCWGRSPESPSPIGKGSRPPTERSICTLDDVHAAIHHYVESIPYDRVISTATHISTDIDFRSVSDAEMSAALIRRSTAGPPERDIYASYINEAYLTALEKYADRIVFQFSFGAEPLPFETSSRLSQRSITQIAEIIGRHPRLRFQCFLANRHTHQSICTLVRELPNLSLAGYWWHNFFPSAIRHDMAERMDMLPANRQVGFFSDAYCVEWTFGKAFLVRRQLAQVLADAIKQGRFSYGDAIGFAKMILFETPQLLLNMIPRKSDKQT